MAFFRQAEAGDTGATKPKVDSFIMSDGVFCINDSNLVKVIGNEKIIPEHENEFRDHISEFVDHAAAQFFTQNPDL